MDYISYTKELENIFSQLWNSWSNDQWEKLILSNSSIVERIIQLTGEVYKNIDEFKRIDYDTCIKEYIINLTNELCKNIIVLFENVLSLKANDTDIDELINIINKGLNILVKVISIEDFHRIKEVISTVVIPPINKLNEKFCKKI